jgi:hypothetical protein
MSSASRRYQAKKAAFQTEDASDAGEILACLGVFVNGLRIQLQ